MRGSFRHDVDLNELYEEHDPRYRAQIIAWERARPVRPARMTVVAVVGWLFALEAYRMRRPETLEEYGHRIGW
ncbi:MAG: hypothetical protein WA840_23345 [Caulobacteraceae bacterium]